MARQDISDTSLESFGLRVFLVRLADDQERARELVGIFAARDVAHLCEFIDLCCDAWDTEYTELGGGGIYWPSFMDRRIPDRIDWEEMPDDYSVIPPAASVSEGEWWDAFEIDNRQWTRITEAEMDADIEAVPGDEAEEGADVRKRPEPAGGAWKRRRVRR